MILYETKFLTLKAAKRQGKQDWVYVSRGNAKNVVVLLPVLKQKNKEEEIIFLITKRPPLIEEGMADFCVELPAGLVGDENPNETLISAIEKELLEETGHKASKIEILLEDVSASAGLTSETAVIAKCTIENKEIVKAPVDDGGVIADRICVKKSEIKNFIKEKGEEGFAISAYALAALWFLT